MLLYAVFMNFSKAFDTVSRDCLWHVLTRLERSAKFINIDKSPHNGMQASIAYFLHLSFSLYLSAMLRVAFEDSLGGVSIQARQNTYLFNVIHFKATHFKAKTKIYQKIVCETLTTVL